jgi:hypothetical protein
MKAKRASTDGERDRFLAQIADLWPAAKGSVAEVRKPCVRPDCKACAEGRKHRAFILSYKDGARRRCLYVPAARVAALRMAIANGRRIEQILSQCGAQWVRQARQAR